MKTKTHSEILEKQFEKKEPAGDIPSFISQLKEGCFAAMLEVENQTREEMLRFTDWLKSTNEFMKATTYSPMYYRYDPLIGGFAIKEIHITDVFEYWKSLPENK